MPFPPWMEEILGLHKAMIACSSAIAQYQAAVASGRFDKSDAPSDFTVKENALQAYLNVYYIAVPMIEQACATAVQKGKPTGLENIPDPSTSLGLDKYNELDEIPKYYRILSRLVYTHKIITIKFLTRIAEEAEEMEAAAD